MYDAWTVIKTLHDERVNPSAKLKDYDRPNLGKLLLSVGKRLGTTKPLSSQPKDDHRQLSKT